MSKHRARGVVVGMSLPMLGAVLLLVVAVPSQAAIVVHTSDFIADGTRTHFNGFESIPNDGQFFTGGAGPYTEDTIQVQQINGDPGNAISVVVTTVWTGFQGSYSWYPSLGDLGYSELSLAGGVDFQDVGFNYGTGFPTEPKDILFELLDNGAVVLVGTMPITAYPYNIGGPDYLGFSGGGFDTIRMRDGSPGGGSVTDGTDQYLAIDNIEMGGGGNGSPELSTWMLLACSGLAGVVLRRRRKA